MPKTAKKQEQKENEDLKENRSEINNPIEKEKVFSEIPIIDFIVPTRKSKKQNSQMSTSTPKRKKITLKEPFSTSTKLIQKKKKKLI